eukprot:TRINITY_DN12697_c0_g1_i1.p1 TRINITY_DN12697_c0_g1~~TRINITY_DN12697_c0_g1_i1.p1  ORF type:complete len:280 (+),score=79.91 TRINITY_DN12697_c0_g1_i1:78-842(+)
MDASDLLPMYLIPHASGIAAWTLFFFVCEWASFLVSPLVSTQYRSLTPRNKVMWANRVASTVNAIVVCPVSAYILWTYFDLRLRIQVELELSNYLFQAAFGYFLWDLYQCLRHLADFGVSFLLHALACLGVYGICLMPTMQVYGSMFLLFELSSPFINAVWLLQKGAKGVPAQVFTVLGLITLLVFFLVRIVLGNIVGLEVWQEVFLVPEQPMSLPVRLFFMISHLALSLLNVFWFVMMIRYVLRSSSHQDKHE